MASRKIVCLGGGIGTRNLIKGLKDYTDEITVVSSMADDGGSSGRLRRLYGILPPGDIISCMAAIGNKEDKSISEILNYRFPGDRYGADNSLEGQKLGNLLLTALYNQTSDFDLAIVKLQEMLGIKGKFLPATLKPVEISAKLKSGKIVEGEENIDLGKYEGDKEIDEVFVEPKDVEANPKVISEIMDCDAVVVGPGDIYSNELPVLILDGVTDALRQTKAKKILIMNVANKPQEAEGYKVSDYIEAFKRHLKSFPFDIVLINNNHSAPIPDKYDYKYVVNDMKNSSDNSLIEMDILDESFPLYHDPNKLAKAIMEKI